MVWGERDGEFSGGLKMRGEVAVGERNRREDDAEMK